jgi:hypothetical protein
MLSRALGESSLHESLYQSRRHSDAEPVDDHAVDSNEAAFSIDERASGIARRKPDISDDPPHTVRSILAGDCVQDTHRQGIMNPERMSVRKYQLARAERLRIPRFEKRTTGRWRGEQRKIMMGMVCECLRFAPLSFAANLERRTARHAVRVRHDEPGTAPYDPGSAAA